MSTLAIEFLRRRGVPPVNHLRLPLEVTQFDLQMSDIVIAVHEPEHRPMVEARWAEHGHAIEYWRVPDIDKLAPSAALQRLERHVDELLAALGAEHAPLQPAARAQTAR
jgi:protein-tyrosine phosphatase